MKSEKYYLRISPGVLKDDIIEETYSGNTFGVYTAMTEILSGGTNGSSLLTGLTIPIVFKQTFNDLGYYSTFDGYLLQKDVTNNFIYSGDPTNPYDVTVYNTSDVEFKKFLQLSDYVLDWGDGSSNQNMSLSVTALTHTYNNGGAYTISLKQTNPWGITEVKKEITVPMTGVTITNPEGNITFTPQGGSWSGTPLSYNFIFSGDAENNVSSQVSSTWTSVPFLVTGYTKSKITDLKQYGNIQYATNVPIIKHGEIYGVIDIMDSEKTGYTINNVIYFDYPDGTTIYITNSSGLTENDLVASAITKNEVLLDMVYSPEIQSEVFIDRGKLTAFEGLERLGEVDNIGDLVSYGYGYFKINNN